MSATQTPVERAAEVMRLAAERWIGDGDFVKHQAQALEDAGLLAKDAKVQHRRVAPGKCACGFDAYRIDGFFIDYHEEILAHLRAYR